MDSLPPAPREAHLNGGDFEILILGPFAPERVEARWHPGLGRTVGPLTAEDTIEARWQARLDEAARRGSKPPYNGHLCRLPPDGVRVRGGVLELVFGPTTYREYVATNLAEEVAGAADERELASPAGVSVALVTADGKLVAARRGRGMFQHAGFRHVIGGHLEQDRHVRGEEVDIFAAIRDEIVEELHCAPEEIGELRCTGLARDRATRKSELTFAVRLARSSRDLSLRNDEHDEFLFVADEADALIAALLDEPRRWVPAGKACLVLYGRVAFGVGWFQQSLERHRATLLG